jgi:hypothetical protein
MQFLSVRGAAGTVLLLTLLSSGCREKWDTTQRPVRDEELETAFFSGLNSVDIPDLAEPQRLRPCCVFGNDVGVSVGSVPVPGYEVSNVLDLSELGTHNYNNGTLSLQPPGEGRRIVTDEASGILYTCRGGFIDIAHVRDNADRTFYLVAQIGRLPATGGTIPLANEGGERRVVVQPLDASCVRAFGIRDVVTGLAEWLDFQASIWHEIATWYRWSSTAFSEQPSAFSPEDLYSNLLGVKIAGEVVRRRGAATEEEYDRNVTAILKDALTKLGPLPKDGSRFAFQYVDGIWWDSTKRVPDNLLVRHRNFNTGPRLYPWKLVDAQPSNTLLATSKEYAQACGGDWTPLGLNLPERIGDVPFRQMATLEIHPDETLINNGFRFPKPGSTVVTPDDFPALIEAIQRACDTEIGAGAGLPAARPNESSRYHG